MPYAPAEKATIYYEERGRGEPLLLIMGFGGTHHAWMAQVPAFRRHYRTIIYDSRGLGRSQDYGEPYRIATLVRDAVAILDHLAIDRSHVLGYSLGGAVAQEMAISCPERIRKLVLAATPPQVRAAMLTPELRRALDLPPDADLEAVARDVGRTNIAQMMPLIARRSFRSPITRWWLSALSHRFSSVISRDSLQRQAVAATGIDTLDRLHMIRAQTLVIAGIKDWLVPPAASERLAARIPDTKLVMVRGASHALAMERACRFNREVLRFLTENERSESTCARSECVV